MKQRSYLALEGITVEFPTRAGRFCALDGIDLEVEKGQFVALIGHSGCGKSTLLNAVAGLVKPTRGAIFLDGELVDAPGPDRAVVFQDHSLLPWLTVEENVRLAVDKTAGGKSKAERRDRSAEHTSELQPLMRISYAVFCLTNNTHYRPSLL